MCETIFGIVSKLSELLQAEKIDYHTAALQIEATITTFNTIRSDVWWKKLCEKAVTFANNHSISIPRQSAGRVRNTPSRLNSYIITSSVGTSAPAIEDYKGAVYFAVLDVLLEELNRRFSSHSLELFKALAALVPTSPLFLSIEAVTALIDNYKLNGKQELEVEFMLAKCFLDKRKEEELLKPIEERQLVVSIFDVYCELSHVSESYPCTLNLLKIALTMGVSTASAERSFSSLRRLKTYLRSTMLDSRLSELALIYIERYVSHKLWDSLDKVLDRFAKDHKNGRIRLL